MSESGPWLMESFRAPRRLPIVPLERFGLTLSRSDWSLKRERNGDGGPLDCDGVRWVLIECGTKEWLRPALGRFDGARRGPPSCCGRAIGKGGFHERGRPAPTSGSSISAEHTTGSAIIKFLSPRNYKVNRRCQASSARSSSYSPVVGKAYALVAVQSPPVVVSWSRR